MTSAPDDDPWRAFVAAPAPIATRQRLLHVLNAARLPAAITAGLALLGSPVGLLWARVSPHVSVDFAADGPSLVHPESSEFFNGDAALLVVLLVAGLLSGVLVWAVARARGIGVPVGIAIGGLIGGGIAQAVGERVVVDPRLADACRQAVCDIYDGTMRVRVGILHLDRGWPGRHEVYLTGIVWSVAALVVFFALTAAFDPGEPAESWTASEAWAPPQPVFDWAPPDRS